MISTTKFSSKFLINLSITVFFVICFFLTVHILLHPLFESLVVSNQLSVVGRSHQECKALHKLHGYEAKCMYLKHKGPCVSQGYLNYLYHFYCTFGRMPFLGFSFLFLWILVMFYLLGSTASDYFCTSLESLSKLLKLSPAIAGVTLLSLGNGAPDVFASIVSIMGSGSSDMGLNTMVGGASFVSCFVVGVICILLRGKDVRIVKSDFVRDVCFYLLVVGLLAGILIRGKIGLWGAVGFLSMYVVYVVVVCVTPRFWTNDDGESVRSGGLDDCGELVTPMLVARLEEVDCMEQGGVQGDERVKTKRTCFCSSCSSFWWVVFGILKIPLDLPRKLTIPVVSEENWSKPFAVTSVALAPIFLSALWIPHSYLSFETNITVYVVAMLIGAVLGMFAYLKTNDSYPPRKFLCPWLAGGFLMSVTWTYIVAQELVGSLVSLGYILEMSQATLGLTVLAWGNSIGDLITNVTMALNAGTEGPQIAISACYAGPIFNVLIGLGLSFVGSCWYGYPTALIVGTNDSYLLDTLVFLAIGLFWALLVLPLKKMRLDGTLGVGLLVFYIVSLSLRVIQTMGLLQLDQSLTDPKTITG